MGFGGLYGPDGKIIFALAYARSDERPEAECKANEALIAAAPEMLHTLKYAEDILQAAASDGRKPSIKDLNDIIEVVRLTVAKAEGRS